MSLRRVVSAFEKAWKPQNELRAHAEAMADALEDLLTAEHSDDMWERAREVGQAYVEWADNRPSLRR